ncbi:MAG: DUF6580 family putative transport protein, partial [Patescibacteria group bacterium]
NFGVWVSGNWYPHTFSGLLSCMLLALPFAKWTLVGDLMFTMIFFGATELYIHRVKYQVAFNRIKTNLKEA